MIKSIWERIFGKKGGKTQQKKASEMNWAQKQIREMAKLKGKLILM